MNMQFNSMAKTNNKTTTVTQQQPLNTANRMLRKYLACVVCYIFKYEYIFDVFVDFLFGIDFRTSIIRPSSIQTIA